MRFFQNQNTALRDRLNNAEATIDERGKEWTTLNALNQELLADLTSKNRTITAQEAAITEQEAAIERLRAELRAERGETEAADAEVAHTVAEGEATQQAEAMEAAQVGGAGHV
jgi:chromosome segregation ATPase